MSQLDELLSALAGTPAFPGCRCRGKHHLLIRLPPTSRPRSSKHDTPRRCVFVHTARLWRAVRTGSTVFHHGSGRRVSSLASSVHRQSDDHANPTPQKGTNPMTQHYCTAGYRGYCERRIAEIEYDRERGASDCYDEDVA
jgi:hypothetical protein